MDKPTTELSELMQHMARGGYRIHQSWGLMEPESSVIDEQPEPVDIGHARRTAPHGSPGGCDDT